MIFMDEIVAVEHLRLSDKFMVGLEDNLRRGHPKVCTELAHRRLHSRQPTPHPEEQQLRTARQVDCLVDVQRP